MNCQSIFKCFNFIQVSILISTLTVSSSYGAGPVVTDRSSASGTLLEFSLAGKKARDGRDGQSYRGQQASSGFGSGSDGYEGRDAGDGEDVTKAPDGRDGNIILNSTQAGVITFGGTLVSSRPGVSAKAQLKDSGFFRPVSRGGNGAMPGYGGWGEKGGDGRRGADGVFRSPGQDGGDGGDGGDAGRGHSGGAAGNGGTIRVGVPSDQLELAILVEANVAGGLGGTHSEHGKAGKGGSGGAGGTGASWTTTSTSTDSKGNKTTTIHYHKAADGSRGSNGSSGASVSTPLYDGIDGQKGQVIWQVLDKDGVVVSEAEDRFQLQLVGFSLTDNNNGQGSDGIFEPGEKGFISDLFVQNTGGLITPRGAKTRLRIKKGDYFYTGDLEFDVPEGLAPGETRELKGPDGEKLKIEFTMKSFDISSPQQEPFIRSGLITPMAFMDVAGVKRVVPEFNLEKSGIKDFTVQFPVLIEPITSLPNLAPGEASKYIIKVTNISGRDFGSLSEIKKHLEIYLKRQGGDLADSSVEFFDMEGKPLEVNSGFLKQIMLLKAGESTMIETVVGVSGVAESYRSAVSTVDLQLDRNGYAEGEDLTSGLPQKK